MVVTEDDHAQQVDGHHALLAEEVGQRPAGHHPERPGP